MTKLNETPENLDRADIEARQLSRLRQVLAASMSSNRFWQQRFADAGLSATDLAQISSLDELQQLPTTSKTDLTQDQKAEPPYGTNLTFVGSDFPNRRINSRRSTVLSLLVWPVHWLLGGL